MKLLFGYVMEEHAKRKRARGRDDGGRGDKNRFTFSIGNFVEIGHMRHRSRHARNITEMWFDPLYALSKFV
jgi:hypothetical protein